MAVPSSRETRRTARPGRRRLWIGLGCSLLIVALIVVAAVGGLAWWYSLPAEPLTVTFVQPTSPPQLASGDAIIFVGTASGAGGVVQIDLLVDGVPAGQRVADEPVPQLEAAFPWSATAIGPHTIDLVARDARGQTSAPAKLLVTVLPAVAENRGEEPAAPIEDEGVAAGGGSDPAEIAAAEAVESPSEPPEAGAAPGGEGQQPGGAEQPPAGGAPPGGVVPPAVPGGGEQPPADGAPPAGVEPPVVPGGGEQPPADGAPPAGEPPSGGPVAEVAQPCPDAGGAADAPPVVTLDVQAVPREDGSVQLEISGAADDDAGLLSLNVGVVATLAGLVLHETSGVACDGQPHCDIRVLNLVVDAGPANVSLTAQDTACQLALAPPWQGQVGEAAPDAPPTMTLRVAVARAADGTATATVTATAEDDSGVGRIDLIYAANQHNFGDTCDGLLRCEIDLDMPLEDGQRRLFVGQAFDVSGQASELSWALLAGIGQPAAVAVHAGTLAALANEIPLGLDLRPEDLIFDPVAAIFGPGGVDGPQPSPEFNGFPPDSFEVNGCIIVQPVVWPDGPFTECEYADLHGVDLSGVDLRYASFGGANFQGATLINTNFEAASLYDSDLRLADLNGANLSSTHLSLADLRGANVTPTTIISPKWRLVWDIATHGADGRVFRLREDLPVGGSNVLDLRAANLREADLRNVEFGLREGVTLDLTSAILEGANLGGAYLVVSRAANANFRGAHMNGTHLSGNLSQADFSGAQMVQATLEGKFLRANLSGAVLTSSTAGFVNLRHANLSGARMRHAYLSYADLRYADLRGADLRDTNFEWAWLHNSRADDQTQFDDKWNRVWWVVCCASRPVVLRDYYYDYSRANLSGVTINTSSFLVESDFSGSHLEGTVFSGVLLSLANFSDAFLEGARFTHAMLDRAVLRRADMRGARLQWATLYGADLTGARLEGAVLAGANLQGAILSGARLTNANLTGAYIGCDFDDSGFDYGCADLRGTVLDGANLTRVNLHGAEGVHAAYGLDSVIWSDTTCVDTTNSDDNGGTCVGHLEN